jgi:molybdopterin/thiamine biosynthesis adenylyltransferase
MNASGDRHLQVDPAGLLGEVASGERSVAILAEDDYAATFAGQAPLALVVDLVARQFGVVMRVAIAAPATEVFHRAFPRSRDIAGMGLAESLVALGRAVAGPEISIEPDSGDEATIVLWVGPGDPPRRGSSLTVHSFGTGWKAFCSTTESAPAAAVDSDVPFGSHLAACLAADRVFRHLRSAPVTGTSAIDLATLRPPRWGAGNPETGEIRLPSSYLIGLGAVGAAFAYTLATTSGISGAIVGIDPQATDTSNRNRLVSMSYADVELPKIELSARLFTASDLAFYPNETRWPDYYSDPHRRAPDDLRENEGRFRYQWVVSAVDKNLVRRNIANVLPRHVLSGSTDGLVAQATYYSLIGDSECLACNHPVPTYDVESLSAQLLALDPEQRRARLVDEMGASLEEWAAIEDYLVDPSCATVGEAALRRLGVEGTTDWSVGFVSVAAGVMLAAAFVRVAREGPEVVFADGSEERLIFWQAPETIVSRARRKNACPVCGNLESQARFAKRWLTV